MKNQVVPVENNLVAWGGPIDLLPAYDEIPETFLEIASAYIADPNKKLSDARGRARAIKFVRAAHAIGGLRAKNIVAEPKKGVDKDEALRHFHAATRAKEALPEHRLAGGAYLLSQWFKDIEYEER